MLYQLKAFFFSVKRFSLQVINGLYSANNSFDFSDGASLATHFLNRTYHLQTGIISLNHIGERILQVKISQIKVDSSDFVVRLLCNARCSRIEFSHLSKNSQIL